MSLVKLTSFSALNNQDLPTVEPVRGSIKRASFETEYLPEILEFLSSLKRDDGNIYVIINALGGSEAWGENNNGDDFPVNTPPIIVGGKTESDWGLAPSDPEAKWGHKTFEQFAKVFRQHKNKLSEGHPEYGEPLFSAWNPGMHRVELVARVRRDEPDIADVIDKLDRNEPAAVSMGCFPAGTPIRMEDGSEKSIELIEEGDWVLTHKGNVKSVSSLKPRPYRGEMMSVRYYGRRSIDMTPEHPVLIIPKDLAVTVNHKHPRFLDDIDIDKLQWVHADHLSVDDVVVEPTFNEVRTPDWANRSLARILGYYLAEGYVIRNREKEICGINFTCHHDDALLEEISSLVESWGSPYRVSVRKRSNSESACSVEIYDSKLATICYQLCGSYASRKKIDRTLMLWDMDLQREFIGAYINGDGCQNRGKWQPGSVTISTASIRLSEQIVSMLRRLDIYASHHSIKHKPSKNSVVRRTTTEYQIHIGKGYVNLLEPYSQKIQPVSIKSDQRVRRIGNYNLFRIKEVSRAPFTGEVFNFEVDGDHSYVAGGIAVHNCRVPFDICSICDNRAKTTKEYCEHLRYNMKQMLPDGRKVKAINYKPLFFDISFVRKGADPTAFTLANVTAGEKIASSSIILSANAGYDAYGDIDAVFGKAAEDTSKTSGYKESDEKSSSIVKRVPGQIQAATSDEHQSILEQFVQKVYPKLQEKEAALPAALLDKLANDYSMSEIWSSMTAAGMYMRPDEFQRIALVQSGQNKLANDLWDNGWVFPQCDPIESDVQVDVDHIKEAVLNELSGSMADRSGYRPFLIQRVVSLDKTAGEYFEEKYVDQDYTPPVNVMPALLALGGIYAGGAIAAKSINPAKIEAWIVRSIQASPEYVRHLGSIFNSKASEIMRSVSKRAWIAPAAIVGTAGLASTIDSMASSRNKGEIYWSDPQISKTSSEKSAGFFRRAMIGIPAAYVAAGYQDAKQMQGERPGFIGRQIQNNAGTVGLGAALGGGVAWRAVGGPENVTEPAKKLWGRAAKWLGGAVKKAEQLDFMSSNGLLEECDEEVVDALIVESVG